MFPAFCFFQLDNYHDAIYLHLPVALSINHTIPFPSVNLLSNLQCIFEHCPALTQLLSIFMFKRLRKNMR